jgi:hypothetical protein
MPRPRRDGSETAPASKVKLTEFSVRKSEPRPRAYLIWDTQRRGLALQIQPTGHKAWKAIYTAHGRPRWFHIGSATAIDLAEARKLAGRIMYQVAEGPRRAFPPNGSTRR